MNLKIICVEFENLKQFENQKFRIDFIASERVLKKANYSSSPVILLLKTSSISLD